MPSGGKGETLQWKLRIRNIQYRKQAQTKGEVDRDTSPGLHRWSDIDRSPLSGRFAMIWLRLQGILIDGAAKRASSYVRSKLLVAAPVGGLLEEIENAKEIPASPISRRTVAVPGTGTDDVANNGEGGGWWILKEMPLEQRPFAH
jgi:hypothetical protein